MKNEVFSVIVASGLLLGGCTVFGQQIPATNGVVQNVPTNNKPADKQPVNNKLDLSGQQLKKVPDYVFNYVNLEELDVSNNQITGNIQSQIGNLKNLKVLKANNNLMTGVPAEIGGLQKLQTLNLSNNSITGLPNELGNLKSLQTFNISGNNYSDSDLKTITQKLSSSTKITK